MSLGWQKLLINFVLIRWKTIFLCNKWETKSDADYIIMPTPLFFTVKSQESIVKENGKENGENNWQFTLYRPVMMFTFWGVI